jgi:hypothetical protein
MANTTHRVLTLNLTSTAQETLSLDPIPEIGSANIANGSIMNDDISGNAGIALSKLADVSGSNLNLDDYLLDLSNNFANFLVTNDDVSDNANIALSKLADVSGSGGMSLEEYLFDLSNNIAGITDATADENTAGYVSFGAQNFGGAKTFKDVVTIDEHQTGTSYDASLNVPIKPYLIIPTSTLSGNKVGGGYFKYAVKQSTSLGGGNTNGIAIVAKDFGQEVNTSFFAELTYLANSTTTNNDGTLVYTSTATTTKLILTCTGLSVVNTLLGEQHASNSISVTTHTDVVDGVRSFVILVNGISFNSLLLDFYGAEQIWQINAISINSETGDAEAVADDFVSFGFPNVEEEEGGGDGQ